MSASRSLQSTLTLFQLIQEDFRQNAELQRSVTLHMETMVVNGTVNRMFDSLLHLLNEVNFSQYSSNYISILNKAVVDQEGVIDAATLQHIKKWTTDLIILGMNELYVNDRLNPYLVSLLRWREVINADSGIDGETKFNKITKPELLRAYVGAVLAQITDYFHESINEHYVTENASLLNHVTSRYSEWVDYVIYSKNQHLNLVGNIKKVMFIGGATIVLGVPGAIAAYAFYSVLGEPDSILGNEVRRSVELDEEEFQAKKPT